MLGLDLHWAMLQENARLRRALQGPVEARDLVAESRAYEGADERSKRPADQPGEDQLGRVARPPGDVLAQPPHGEAERSEDGERPQDRRRAVGVLAAEVGVVEGFAAVTGSGAVIRIEFDDGEDYAWALDMWRSLRPG